MVLTHPMYWDGRFLGRYIHTLLQLNSIYFTTSCSSQHKTTMPDDYKGLNVPGTDPFDEWFDEEREPLLDEDVDDIDEDDYSEDDYE